MPRGRPRKNPIPIEIENPSVEVTSNVVGEIDSPVTVENTAPVTKKKFPPIDSNTICMACGNIIPDTPNKIDLAMWLDTAPYKFNTKLNDKGRIILCHKCEKYLIEAIDKELKKMGCKQKYELEPETEMAEYPKLNPEAFQTFIEKNREENKE